MIKWPVVLAGAGASARLLLQLAKCRRIKEHLGREWGIPFGIMAFAPVVWYIALGSHSYIHYWFTYRELCVSIFALLTCLVKMQDGISEKDAIKRTKAEFTYLKRVCKKVTCKQMARIGNVAFIITMLPVAYLSFVNRASGDDYGYGVKTRAAWCISHSFMEVLKAACQTVEEYYYSWQGTWFSVFLFSLQPEVFSEKAYVITAFLMLSFWIGSTILLFRQLLYKELGLNKWSSVLITTLFLTINIQFIPSTKSSIFWYNGTIHYMLPFSMCQILLVCFLHYRKDYKFTYIAGITVIMFLLGGSNYQTALFALIAAAYTIIVNYSGQKDKRIFTLIIPIMMEVFGLIISMKAPGNRVRGGEQFGFSMTKGIKAIEASFIAGIKDIVGYCKEKPLVIVGLLLLFLIMAGAFKKKEEEKNRFFLFVHPLISIIALFCIYCAMQTPAIYADVAVSGGVYNTNYQVFLLTFSGILLIAAKKLADKSRLSYREFNIKLLLPGIFFCFITSAVCRSNMKESTLWVCLTYITSGQASEYKEQMELQTRLLMDENARDVVIPFVNDVQGPLMQMPVTDDPDAWTNVVTAQFYGKNSVKAMSRLKWQELYGNEKN